LRPGNLHRSAITMFFLYVDFSIRRDRASFFIVFDRDEREIGAERFEDDLSLFAAPDLDDVLVHVLIFIFSGADGHFLPVDPDAVPFAFGVRPSRTGEIRRDREFVGYAGVHNGKHLPVAFHFKEFGVDPAFILAVDPDPVVGVGATDEFDVRALDQCIKVKVLGAGTITATQ